MRAELVNHVLVMAICQRQPAAGLLMHTDRGSQYGAESYRHHLTQHGIAPSMSRKGHGGRRVLQGSHRPGSYFSFIQLA